MESPLVSLADDDIICGHKAKSRRLNHNGNENYKSIIQQHRQAFQEAEKEEDKSTIIQQVISQFEGRLVKSVEQDKKSQLEQLSTEDVNKKVLKDLRRINK